MQIDSGECFCSSLVWFGQILYNYEVSIYEELSGSNTWNGSVLAIMLLTGSAGAMLPTWLHQNENTANGLGSVDSELLVCHRLIMASLVSSLALVLFLWAWKLILSISFLALFFASWQYINAVVYARLALRLKAVQVQLHLTSTPSHSGDNAYSPLTRAAVLKGCVDARDDDVAQSKGSKK
jgi:hypothetical protein